MKTEATHQNPNSQQVIEASTEPNCGEVCATVARMPGVVSVWVQRYEVQVQIAPSYSWDEVEPQIVEFLRPFCS